MGHAITAASNSIPAPVIIIYLAVVILEIASFWRVFTKAGQPGWAAIIPIYNYYVLLKVVGRQWWWLLLLLIPFVNIVIVIVIFNDLSKSFGKSGGFTVGLVLLPFIFFPILAFGSAQYQGPAASTGAMRPGGGYITPGAYGAGAGAAGATGAWGQQPPQQGWGGDQSGWGAGAPAQQGQWAAQPSAWNAPAGSANLAGGYAAPQAGDFGAAGAAPSAGGFAAGGGAPAAGGYGTDTSGAFGGAPASTPAAGAAAAPAASDVAANWYADPTGKHQLRYWSGAAWTEHVSDNGVQATDPV